MDLAKIVNNKSSFITSVEIAKLIGKRHDHVMRDIIVIIRQGVSQSNFGESDYTNDRGRIYKCFNLTKKGSLILASGYDAVLREKIIDRWEELEINNQAHQLPQTFAQALALAAEQALKIEEQQKAIEVMKPKEEFFDAVADSKDAVSMNTVAKVLGIKGMGRNNLFEFLRNNGVLMNNNVPFQKHVEAGYFRVVEQKYMKDGEQCITTKTLVYQKGVDFIRKMVMKSLK